MIATIVGEMLSVFTVSLSDGTVYKWRGGITVPAELTSEHTTIRFGAPRIVALAPCGEFEVWLAVAADTEQFALFRLSQECNLSVVRVVSGVSKGTYAAFLGMRLLALQDRKIVEIVPGGSGPKNWKQGSVKLGQKDILAIDVLETGAGRIVAYLAQDSAKNVEIGGLVQADPEVIPWTRPLAGHPDHMSLVRTPEDAREISVMWGAGFRMTATQLRVNSDRRLEESKPERKWWRISAGLRRGRHPSLRSEVSHD